MVQIDEHGIELSGGQQQRFFFARALYKDAPILVLDEPTAALDPIAESEIYMLKKLSAKENYRNIRQCFHILRQLDPKYIVLSGMAQLLTVLMPYITLWLSSFVLDGILKAIPYQRMITVVLICVGLSFIVQCVKNWLENQLQVRKGRIARLYEYMKQEKLIQMDYSRIDSPEVEQILRRIDEDQNWGSKFHSIIWGLHSIWAAVFNIIGAIVLGVPILKQIILFGGYEIAVVSLILIAVVVIGLKCRSYFWSKIMECNGRST